MIYGPLTREKWGGSRETGINRERQIVHHKNYYQFYPGIGQPASQSASSAEIWDDEDVVSADAASAADDDDLKCAMKSK